MKSQTPPRTLYRKLVDSHTVTVLDAENVLLFCDLHLMNEYTSPQAFAGLHEAGRDVAMPAMNVATVSHVIPTHPVKHRVIQDPASALQARNLKANCLRHDIPLFDTNDRLQGIEHIVAPEHGMIRPGMVVICGDSHTTTYGAVGALGFGIGTTEVEHVLATQTLVYRLAQDLRIRVDGRLPIGTTSKDLVLMVIARIGAQGARGYAVEFCGSAIDALSVEARFTLCNMAVEAGARGALIAPDATAIDYVLSRAPDIDDEQRALALRHWATLHSDPAATFDVEHVFDAADVAPYVTWGTSPDQAIPIDGVVPPAGGAQRASLEKALRYTGLSEGATLEGLPVQHVFIGSCTNARIEDLRAVAAVVAGRSVATGVRAMVVPGSGAVKEQAEAEGIADLLIAAGFEWRQPGCSMCLAMNDDVLEPGQRCASTTNRNFEGRQGRGAITHLMSPAMAAAAALTGSITDVRKLRPSMSEPTVPSTRIEGVAAPIPLANLDTDQIMPKQFLRGIDKTGLDRGLLWDLRFDGDGRERSDFVLNQPAFRHAPVLVAGPNFGCGSSREHAVWGLQQYGVRAVIASSFGEIFHSNAMNNRLLAVVLAPDDAETLMAEAIDGPLLVVIDVEAQVVRTRAGAKPFALSARHREMFVNGLDLIGATLRHRPAIEAFALRHRTAFPWMADVAGRTKARLDAAEQATADRDAMPGGEP